MIKIIMFFGSVPDGKKNTNLHYLPTQFINITANISNEGLMENK